MHISAILKNPLDNTALMLQCRHKLLLCQLSLAGTGAFLGRGGWEGWQNGMGMDVPRGVPAQGEGWK